MTDEPTTEATDDDLAGVPAERLAAMLRDKRKAEQAVRGRLRDAEADRDRLAASVQAFQSRALMQAAKAAGVIESALDDLPGRLNVTDLLGEDGTLDDDKTTAALDGLKTARPHWFGLGRPTRSGVELSGGTGEPSTSAPAASWADVLSV